MRKVEGEIFGLGIDHKNLKVMLRFSENISLVTMDPDEAQRLGVAMIFASETLKRIQIGGSSEQKPP